MIRRLSTSGSDGCWPIGGRFVSGYSFQRRSLALLAPSLQPRGRWSSPRPENWLAPGPDRRWATVQVTAFVGRRKMATSGSDLLGHRPPRWSRGGVAIFEVLPRRSRGGVAIFEIQPRWSHGHLGRDPVCSKRRRRRTGIGCQHHPLRPRRCAVQSPRSRPPRATASPRRPSRRSRSRRRSKARLPDRDHPGRPGWRRAGP